MLHIAAGVALTPDLLPAPAPKDRPPLGDGQRQRLGVHIGEGQHLFGVVVLHDGRNEALLIKFQFHNLLLPLKGDTYSLS